MKVRFSLCLIALGLTAQLAGQTNSGDVHISLKEAVPVFEHCGHIEEDANAQQTCFNRFIMNHIMNELQWPEGLDENGLVFVEVVFDAMGKITQVESVRSYDDRAAEEAVRALQSLPDAVEPAKVQGVPSAYSCAVPVSFER
ncbi:MAG: energy transducer TonB [Schleiferiaceae bacterium]|nr:energy transducer TonB [Schleiferiaceae bacterium]MDG1918374.1 energy transducer TonB [Schleiferiaceae bacterium]